MKTLMTFAVVSLLTMTFAQISLAADRPNVLFILTDDQRYDALSCMGHPHLKTPHIDQLAEEGLLFKNHFCTTSLCSPSRASILSGLYAHTHGVSNNFTEYPTEMISFPLRLQESGYNTAYIGKWHMGEKNDDPRPGFDYFVTHKGQGKYFDTEFNFNGKGRRIVKGYYTTVVTDMAEKWISEQKDDKPWMLMLGHKAPHSFYLPEKKYEHVFDDVDIQYPETAFNLEDKPAWFKKRLDTWHGIYGPLFNWREKFPDKSPEAVKDFARMVKAYWGTIISVDDSVGRLYEFLEKRGELDNTLVIFTSDNGLLEGEHGMVDKRTGHEPSIRIPLVVRYPGITKPADARVVEEITATIDFAPTILDICGAKPLKKVHGSSWKRLAEGDTTDWRDSFYYEYNYEFQFPYTPNVRALRTAKWKYIRYPHGDGSPDKHMAELYNLKKDPAEDKNLINKPYHAKRVKELRAELDRLIAEHGDGKPDTMPVDQGIKSGLPDKDIR
ncbi:MAG: acetylglucosamine-6-sulfatase [Blastopirellula sp.]|nr:MAG: acetylglucosamine-6-sulfatase [Blastopirellula sp.]